MENSSWVKSATSHFRVLLMDQRGTGRSSSISVANLLAKGSAQEQALYLQHFRFTTAEVASQLHPVLAYQGRLSLTIPAVVGQSTYVSLQLPSSHQHMYVCICPALPERWVFTGCRADSIVADAEVVRVLLLAKGDPQASRWSLLGQSFGGFCAVQYLSVVPQGETSCHANTTCKLLASFSHQSVSHHFCSHLWRC